MLPLGLDAGPWRTPLMPSEGAGTFPWAQCGQAVRRTWDLATGSQVTESWVFVRQPPGLTSAAKAAGRDRCRQEELGYLYPITKGPRSVPSSSPPSRSLVRSLACFEALILQRVGDALTPDYTHDGLHVRILG